MGSMDIEGNAGRGLCLTIYDRIVCIGFGSHKEDLDLCSFSDRGKSKSVMRSSLQSRYLSYSNPLIFVRTSFEVLPKVNKISTT